MGGVSDAKTLLAYHQRGIRVDPTPERTDCVQSCSLTNSPRNIRRETVKMPLKIGQDKLQTIDTHSREEEPQCTTALLWKLAHRGLTKEI